MASRAPSWILPGRLCSLHRGVADETATGGGPHEFAIAIETVLRNLHEFLVWKAVGTANIALDKLHCFEVVRYRLVLLQLPYDQREHAELGPID